MFVYFLHRDCKQNESFHIHFYRKRCLNIGQTKTTQKRKNRTVSIYILLLNEMQQKNNKAIKKLDQVTTHFEPTYLSR